MLPWSLGARLRPGKSAADIDRHTGEERKARARSWTQRTRGVAVLGDAAVAAAAGAVLSSDFAAAGSIFASRARASAAVAAVMVTWPTLRWHVTSVLPYQCTVAPGTCMRSEPGGSNDTDGERPS